MFNEETSALPLTQTANSSHGSRIKITSLRHSSRKKTCKVFAWVCVTCFVVLRCSCWRRLHEWSLATSRTTSVHWLPPSCVRWATSLAAWLPPISLILIQLSSGKTNGLLVWNALPRETTSTEMMSTFLNLLIWLSLLLTTFNGASDSPNWKTLSTLQMFCIVLYYSK